MSVTVAGQRHRLAPPVLGDCQDPDCRTVGTPDDRVGAKLVGSAWEFGGFNGVAERERGTTSCSWRPTTPAGSSARLTAERRTAFRVCAPCDERALRAWLEDDR